MIRMFHFDPWKLLGLNPKSTIDEARRAYYKLAVIVHPDKGGSAEDMRVLYDAYKWVYNQLDGASFPVTVDDPSKTPIIDTVIGMDRASLEACYKTLRPKDDARTQTIALDWVKYLVERDLMVDKDLKSLEEYVQEGIDVVLQAYQQETCYHASIPDGYGSYMDLNENMASADDDDEINKMKTISLEDDHEHNGHRFYKELSVYTEPICPLQTYEAKNPVSVPSKIDDYSATLDGLVMTDYALAHSEHIISNTPAYDEEKTTKNKSVVLHSYQCD